MERQLLNPILIGTGIIIVLLGTGFIFGLGGYWWILGLALIIYGLLNYTKFKLGIKITWTVILSILLGLVLFVMIASSMS